MILSKIKEKISSEFIRNSLTLLSGTTIAQAVTFLIYLILPRLYTPAEMGVFALFMNLVSVLSVFSTGRYELAIMLPAKDIDALRVSGISMIICFMVTALLAVLILIFNNLITNMLGEPHLSFWLYFVPISFFLTGFTQTATLWANRNKSFRLIAQSTVCQGVSSSGIKLGLGFISAGSAGLLIGALIGQVATAFWLLIKTIGTLPAKFKAINIFDLQSMTALMKKYSVYPKYNMIHAFTNNFSGSLPVFLLTSAFSSTVVGYYSFAITIIFRPLNIFTNSIHQVLSQKLIEKHNKNEAIFPSVLSSLRHLAVITAIPFVVLFFVAPTVFSFLFGTAWYDAGVYVRILTPWLFLSGLTAPLSFIPEIFFKQGKAMIIDIVYLGFRLAGLYIGIQHNSITLGLLLFSLSGVIVLSYNIGWYLSLCKKNKI